MASYRSTFPLNSSDDDSSDGGQNSHSDDDQPWKRRKTTYQSEGVHCKKQETPGGTSTTNPNEDAATMERWLAAGGSSDSTEQRMIPSKTNNKDRWKRNNIWGQIAQEQNEAHVAREMDGFDMELSRSRDVESYDYRHASDDKPTRVRVGGPTISKQNTVGERELKQGFGSTNDDDWLVGRHGARDDEDSSQAQGADARTSRPVHERLGPRSLPTSDYRSPMKFISIDQSLSKKEIAGKMAYSLQEAKRELIVRVVDILGVEKSLKLWNETKDTEQTGGMMVMDDSRRRLPGGVFLQLMKSDREVTKKQIRDVFSEEKKKDHDEKHRRERSRRRKTTRGRLVAMEDANGEEECREVGVPTPTDHEEKEETKHTSIKMENMEDGELDDGEKEKIDEHLKLVKMENMEDGELGKEEEKIDLKIVKMEKF